jgi:penicillin-insensitive murein endopeptidase
MCEEAGVDRKDFHKIRPYWGHHYHMHIRIGCPADSVGCRPQATTPHDDGCGKEINDWIALLQRPPPPPRPGPVPKQKPKPPITLADLPAECRVVIETGKSDGSAAAAATGRTSSTP